MFSNHFPATEVRLTSWSRPSTQLIETTDSLKYKKSLIWMGPDLFYKIFYHVQSMEFNGGNVNKLL